MGRKFLAALRDGLWLDPTEAAKVAGYSRPEEDGQRLYLKYSHLIEKDKDRVFALGRMSSEECQYILAGVARGKIAASPQQVKAIELVARIHGLLTDKVDLSLPIHGMERVFQGMVAQAKTLALLPASSPTIDAELVPSSASIELSSPISHTE